MRKKIFLVAAAAAWLYVALSIGRGVLPAVQRFFMPRTTDLDGWMTPASAALLGLAVLLGFVAALDQARGAPANGYLPPRSSLVTWPGWPLAAAGFAAAAAAGWFYVLPLPNLAQYVFVSLSDAVWMAIPLALAVGAVVSAGWGRQAAALFAAPLVLALSVAITCGLAIFRLAEALAPAAAAMALGLGGLAALARSRLLAWPALGFAALAAFALPLASGLFTPSEVLALACLPAAALLAVLEIEERGTLRRALAAGAADVIALATMFAVVMLVPQLAVRATGVALHLPAWLTGLPALWTPIALAAALILAGFVLTPVLAIALLALLLAQQTDGGLRASCVLVLAGMVPLLLRAVDWSEIRGTEPEERLSKTAGFAAATLMLGGIALTLAGWQYVEAMKNLIR